MRRVTALAAAVIMLTGCGMGPSDNQDPRKGRVTTERSNCLYGSCVWDWHVCVGPDLLMHVDDAEPEEYTVEDAPACVPDGADHG